MGGETRWGIALLALCCAAAISLVEPGEPQLTGISSARTTPAGAQIPGGHDTSDGRARQLFVERILTLCEPESYFDTDNLISNESSYLHVVGALERMGTRGGAYVGVGPDQNFSYIAAIRPEIAFLVDIRRDNLLLHLLFKSIFELAESRVEFLALLYGRPLPESVGGWHRRPLADLVAYIDEHPAEPDSAVAVRQRVHSQLLSIGFPLDTRDLATIDRFHRSFIDAGLSLRFHSYGRPPRFFYPDHRQLLLEHDLGGRQVSFVASEDRYRAVRELQLANRVLPVVGDLAGEHTLPEIGRLVTKLGLEISALYASNVEFYLWRDGRFQRYAQTVSGLPANDSSVIIRSHFGSSWGRPHPSSVAGYYSTQLLQRMRDFGEAQRARGYSSYFDLVTRDALDLRAVAP